MKTLEKKVGFWLRAYHDLYESDCIIGPFLSKEEANKKAEEYRKMYSARVWDRVEVHEWWYVEDDGQFAILREVSSFEDIQVQEAKQLAEKKVKDEEAANKPQRQRELIGPTVNIPGSEPWLWMEKK